MQGRPRKEGVCWEGGCEQGGPEKEGVCREGL